MRWENNGNDIGSLYRLLKYLADQHRDQVYRALEKGFGDDNALFYSLISSAQTRVFETWPTNWQEIAQQSETSDKKLLLPRNDPKVMYWIMTGCAPYATTERDL